MKIADYFDRIYVINLPERTDRRKRVTRELRAARFDVHSDKIRFYPGVRVSDAGGFMSAGLRGCFLSHYQVIKEARDAGLSKILVMEDDLVIKPEFRRSEDGLVRALEAKAWGFVYLGHVLPTMKQEKSEVFQEYSGPVLLAHFYGIHSAIYDRLLEHMHGVLTWPRYDPRGSRISPDGAFSMFRQLNPDIRTLVARPSLGEQGSSASDIMPHWFDKIGWLRPGLNLARKVKYRLVGTRKTQ
jgi:hypothetical protein